jgi:hypothetical protein
VTSTSPDERAADGTLALGLDREEGELGGTGRLWDRDEDNITDVEFPGGRRRQMLGVAGSMQIGYESLGESPQWVVEVEGGRSVP